MRRWTAAIVLPAVGLSLAACGRPAPPGGQPPGRPPGQRPTAQTIEVTTREWAFEPSPLVAKAGKITFRIKNNGGVEHNFLVENTPGAQVEAIKPGESKSLTVELTRGEYTVFCNLPGHREAGMVGTLKISE